MGVDIYGHCVKCSKDLIINRVVGGKVQKMFHPDHDHTEFVLNNHSKMIVCMCKPCKKGTNLSDSDVHDDIMESVFNGWKLEQDLLLGNGNTTKKDYERTLDYHRPLKILFHSEGIDDYVINDRLKKLEEQQ